MPCIDRVVELEVETPQIRCPGCGRFHTLRPDFVHPTMGFTWRLMRCISSLLMYVPARKLSEMYGLAPSTILRIDREILKRELPPPKLDGIEGILVDEKYLGPSYGFVTLVINARTGEPLHIAKGRDAGALESFFNRLTKVQKSSIRFLGIDRANAYRAAALKHLPGVEVCYDAYHLVSNMNGVVDKVRRGEMSHPSEALKRRLKGKRYHLPKPKKTSKGMQGRSLRSCLLITRSSIPPIF